MTAQTPASNPGRQPHNSSPLANIAAAVVVAIGLIIVSGLVSDSSEPEPKPSATAAQVKTTPPAASPTPIATSAPASPITAVKPTASPSRKPAPTWTAPEPDNSPADDAEPDRRIVHQGAFCAADDEGEFGWTVRGVRMECRRKPGDDYLRWRRAG